MPIKAVISDFGGVLVRTLDTTGRAKWEARLGVTQRELIQMVFDSETSQRASVGVIPASAVWDALAVQLNLSADEIRAFRHDFFAGDQVNAELLDFIQSLRPRHKTAILSNAWSDLRRVVVDRLALDTAFDTMVISAEEGVVKPDRRIYEIAVVRLGVALDEAVFIDDMEQNVEAARAYGMRGVLFRDTAPAIAEVRQHLSE
jgi:putative hydrolase of the HAD superfamily